MHAEQSLGSGFRPRIRLRTASQSDQLRTLIASPWAAGLGILLVPLTSAPRAPARPFAPEPLRRKHPRALGASPEAKAVSNITAARRLPPLSAEHWTSLHLLLEPSPAQPSRQRQEDGEEGRNSEGRQVGSHVTPGGKSVGTSRCESWVTHF